MVPPSNEALRLIIETEPALVNDLNRFYGDATPDGGLDKVEREMLLDLLSRHFTGRSWPRSGAWTRRAGSWRPCSAPWRLPAGSLTHLPWQPEGLSLALR